MSNRKRGETVKHPRTAKVKTSADESRSRVFTREAGLFKVSGIGKSKDGGFSWRKHELDK